MRDSYGVSFLMVRFSLSNLNPHDTSCSSCDHVRAEWRPKHPFSGIIFIKWTEGEWPWQINKSSKRMAYLARSQIYPGWLVSNLQYSPLLVGVYHQPRLGMLMQCSILLGGPHSGAFPGKRQLIIGNRQRSMNSNLNTGSRLGLLALSPKSHFKTLFFLGPSRFSVQRFLRWGSPFSPSWWAARWRKSWSRIMSRRRISSYWSALSVSHPMSPARITSVYIGSRQYLWRLNSGFSADKGISPSANSLESLATTAIGSNIRATTALLRTLPVTGRNWPSWKTESSGKRVERIHWLAVTRAGCRMSSV